MEIDDGRGNKITVGVGDLVIGDNESFVGVIKETIADQYINRIQLRFCYIRTGCTFSKVGIGYTEARFIRPCYPKLS